MDVNLHHQISVKIPLSYKLLKLLWQIKEDAKAWGVCTLSCIVARSRCFKIILSYHEEHFMITFPVVLWVRDSFQQKTKTKAGCDVLSGGFYCIYLHLSLGFEVVSSWKHKPQINNQPLVDRSDREEWAGKSGRYGCMIWEMVCFILREVVHS